MADIRRAIEELAGQGLDERTFVSRAALHVRQGVPFDVCSWLTYDPDVVLPTNGYDTGEPRPFEVRLRYCANEQLEDDVHKFRDLALAAVPVGLLDRTRQSAQGASRRFRELLEPAGMAAELRAALVMNGCCWGSLTLERSRGGPSFSLAEARAVADIGAALALGLARASFARQAAVADVPDGPGVLVIDAHGGIVSASEAAAGWLDVLRGTVIGPQPAVPVPVLAVAARSRAVGQTRLRVRTGDGHWLTLHGGRQRSPTQDRIHAACEDQVFVTIARSRSSEVLPLIARQYGLTPREMTLLGPILRGLSTRRISEQLRISEYTVQDHLKSIFQKTAIRGRRELAHQLALDLFGTLAQARPQYDGPGIHTEGS